LHCGAASIETLIFQSKQDAKKEFNQGDLRDAMAKPGVNQEYSKPSVLAFDPLAHLLKTLVVWLPARPS